MSAVFILLFLGLAGMTHSETISSKYQALSTSYHLPSWRPHLPNLPPSVISSPLEPSNTSLEIENGEVKDIPAGLNKATPDFHLLMSALDDSPEFCKTTLSAMLLNYPPPTIVNLHQSFKSQFEREVARLKGILAYLKDKKVVRDEDLVLIVDGTDTWFQLPSDVMIRQYQNVLADANKRLMSKYGLNKDNTQRFNQTIVFGAEKGCEGEDLACKYVPESILPGDIYGKNTGKEAVLTAARYLDSGMTIGPAKDLRALYEVAVTKFGAEKSQAGTAQSVFATMFGEQQLARDAKPEGSMVKVTKWLNWFGSQEAEPTIKESTTVALEEDMTYEFSMGLDYTHTLFQPFIYAATDELVPLPHDNSTDLSNYHHAGTPTPLLYIPTALQQARPPFWRPDFSKQPSPPDMKLSFIEKLAIQDDLDSLKPRDTTWASLELVQNTYTGAIPAALHLNTPPPSQIKIQTPNAANVTWNMLWYADYERALLRAYLRLPQSPIGYHDASIGGDRLWDSRGGRGGVWTQTESIWLPWGEVDGVCGTLDQLKTVFADGKGIWLHEKDKDAEAQRKKEEKEFKENVAKAKEDDAAREEEARVKAEEEQEEQKKQKEENDKHLKEQEDKKIKEQQVKAEEKQKQKQAAQDEKAKKISEQKVKAANGGRRKRRRRWIR